MINENELAKEVESALDLKLMPKASVLPVTKAEHPEIKKHSQRLAAVEKELDELLHEIEMTIRIINEAKRRL